MLGYSFSFKAYAKKVRENKTECSLKTTEVLLYSDGHMFSFIFIEEEQVQIALRATQTLDALIFLKNICLISGLKFALSDVRSFLPDNQSALKKIVFRPALSSLLFNLCKTYLVYFLPNNADYQMHLQKVEK